MSKKPSEFQKERLEWSRWKHAILEGYLPQMAIILRRFGPAYIVDGFAGPGRYIDDDQDGSPLLAARHAAELEAFNSDYQLRCINVEQNKEVFSNLQKATMPFERFVTNYQGNFSAFVPAILQAISDKPTLFFLDPIGLRGLEWDSLLPILGRTEEQGKTELLIRYDAQTALRNKDINQSLLLDVFGVDDASYWEEYIVQCGEDVSCRKDGMTSAYEDRLRTNFDYVTRIPIQRRDEQLKYYLIFATRSLKGVVCFYNVLFNVKDIRDTVLDSERRARNIPKQLGMFEPTPDEELIDLLEVLKESILKVLPKGESQRRDDLRATVALQEGNFGLFSGSHFTAVLGGSARNVKMPRGFVSLKKRIEVTEETPGSHYAYIRRVS